jgi:DNA-binding transcriptional regulator LsrR (DeoR family)
MPKRNPPVDDLVVFRVAELFFRGMKVRDIAKKVNEELHPTPPLTRETVYPILAQAKAKRFVRLVPPVEKSLTEEVANRFHLPQEDIRVIRTPGKASNAHVATAAAKLALALIAEIGDGSDHVTIGLGPGRASLDFSWALAELLTAATQPPSLRLIGISAGCPAKSPQYASSSFFNLFPPEVVEEYVGLFAQTLIKTKEFPKLKKHPGVAEVFKTKDSIDLVVTAMGDIQDEDDLLRTFLKQQGTNVDSLVEQGWIGNVQYRPYTATGYVREKADEYRAVTLFELEDFFDMARQKKREVLLIARQCGRCGLTRARSLRPLLTAKPLKVWSKLVMDVATARELLQAES